MQTVNLQTLFQTLNSRGIKYALVGGLAVNLYGYQRFTRDVDLIVSLASEELETLIGALDEMGFYPIYPVALKDLQNPAIRKQWITERNMTVFSVVSDQLPGITLDLFVDPPYSYADIENDLHFASITENLQVPVINLDRLIQMKEDVGRDQDKTDVEQLRKIKEEYHRGNSA